MNLLGVGVTFELFTCQECSLHVSKRWIQSSPLLHPTWIPSTACEFNFKIAFIYTSERGVPMQQKRQNLSRAFSLLNVCLAPSVEGPRRIKWIMCQVQRAFLNLTSRMISRYHAAHIYNSRFALEFGPPFLILRRTLFCVGNFHKSFSLSAQYPAASMGALIH